ncbi:uncharacterized protein LOC100838789 [Brachypodium distachyon]|uniref:IST1-like protein n=2 Tax=Brachypodium distachyon TaxID=15368 RepID=I1HQT0_BRADI|nr:uncharacterized protein LOC100838789 [Brachypodium distachyon]KQK09398.1 hypothetical protein BRADI_2g47747v3 [Brachypodium distachyon]|eukprot:XP_003569648.1 uncharacterized protein LOC100838789 [Brachypodium distachyon]
MHKSKGKLSGVLHKGFKPDKCKISLKMAMARIKLLRNKKEVQVRQMRREVAQLLDGNQDQTARIRVEHVIREEKFMQAYDLIEVYCELIVARMSIIDSQKTCPIDLKEAIASVIFASVRCSDVTELADVKKNFTSKYGKEFAAAALEVRPDSGVNRLVIEKLSAGAPDIQTKTKTLSSIAAEHNIKWEPKAFEEKSQRQNEDLMYGSTYSGGNSSMSGPSASSMPTPQPVAHPYSSVQSDTSRMPTGATYPSPEVPANPNPYGTANFNASAQENIRDPDVSVSPSSQHVTSATTYSSAEIPGSNNFSHGNTGNASVSRPYSQYGTAVADPRSRTEEINQPRERKSSVSGSNWNVEFKDATSAAQAAAESAEMASIAARAAAQLASRGNFSVEQNTYESSAYMHDTAPRKQQADRLMKNDNRRFNEQSSGSNDPRIISSNARKDEERAETNRVSSQNTSTPYSSPEFHSYAPESRTDMYGMPTEPSRDHSFKPPYFDDSSEKESNIGRQENHPFDLHVKSFPDAEFDGHRTKDMESRQASFDQENINNYHSNFSASHVDSSTVWDNQNEKSGADSSAVVFDQYDYDVEEENLLDPFSSKHTEELPTVQDHKDFSSADWSQQTRSESPVDHSTSRLFSRTETQPSYDLGANKEDIPLPPSYDNIPPSFDSDGVCSDEEITGGMHVDSLRSHSRGSDYSENNMFNRSSGKLVPDVNDIEDYESRSRKQYQNPPGSNVFHKEQQSDGSPRSDYLGAQGNLGFVPRKDYDLSDEEAEPHKLKGTSSEITGANENQPLSLRVQSSATSEGSDEGDLGLNYGRLTPGLRNKLRQPPQYKNSGVNTLPKQSSLQKAPASIEESVHSKEKGASSEQTSDTPKSSRTTKSSFGANYSGEHYNRKHTVVKPEESTSPVTRNNFYSRDTGKLSDRSGTTSNPSTTKSSIRENSSQELHHERPSIGARTESGSRNGTYFDSDDSEEELERRQAGQTKLPREQIQSRRTREVTSDTKRDGRVRTGVQYANETVSTPNETKNPIEAFSNSSTEQRRKAPAYSRVSVQQSSPKPVRVELPMARGKWQEDEPSGSSSPENVKNTETSRGTLKGSTPTSAPAHVHPKLPTDYDSFAAHFMSLRTNRR